jgi:hypothetical protein
MFSTSQGRRVRNQVSIVVPLVERDCGGFGHLAGLWFQSVKIVAFSCLVSNVRMDPNLRGKRPKEIGPFDTSVSLQMAQQISPSALPDTGIGNCALKLSDWGRIPVVCVLNCPSHGCVFAGYDNLGMCEVVTGA